MKTTFVILAAIVLLCLGNLAQADVFNLGSGLTNLETVFVGDARNVGDVYGGYGAVAYNYNIGKYEVTTAQYCDFLNQKAKSDPYGLYNSLMDVQASWAGCNIRRSGNVGSYSYTVGDGADSDIAAWGNRPVNCVSFWDACRFSNWLCNGQGNGDTETGAYNLAGYTGSDGRTIQRNPGCAWAVANESEWYKAAYYRGGGRNVGYWFYATRSDAMPSNVGADGYADPGNHANYCISSYTLGAPYYRTNVGEFESSSSAYGTFDQDGNVSEWTETMGSSGTAYRSSRGGSWHYADANLSASVRVYGDPSTEAASMGFRVVQLAVPEPSSVLALLGGLAGVLGMRRRRA